MDILELRVNNLIYNPEGKIFKVAGVLVNTNTINDMDNCTTYRAKDCNPITITPDQLREFGWTAYGGAWMKYDPHPDNVFSDSFYFCLIGGHLKIGSDFRRALQLPRRLEYLHLIQNTCFDLSGEELKIKK